MKKKYEGKRGRKVSEEKKMKKSHEEWRKKCLSWKIGKSQEKEKENKRRVRKKKESNEKKESEEEKGE